MRCTSCDYPLWNLAARSCPECGQAFTPREYSFRPGSVRFCCPTCDQQYYGTGAAGLPVPDRFECVKCGETVSLDDMVVRPQEGVAEEETRPDRMPWLERRTRGTVKAWFATVGKAMIAPSSLARSIPLETGWVGPYLFMLGTTLLFASIGMILPQISMLFLMAGAGGGGGGGPTVRGAFLGITLAWIGFAVMFAVVLPVIWIVLTHGLLLVTGRRPERLQRTWQAICYSSGAGCLTAIPCLPYIGPLWWVVSAAVGVGVVHGISGLRAAFATAVGGLFSVLGSILLSAALLVGFAAPMARTTSTAPIQIVTPERRVHDAFRAFAEANDGRMPSHGLELLTTGLRPDDYVVTGAISMDQVRVPGGTLLDLAVMSPEQLEDVVRRAVRQLDPDRASHRVGDLVFFSTGESGAGGSPRLLVAAILAPAGGSAVLIYADGTDALVDEEAIGDVVERQNTLRAELGLPRLPSSLDGSRESSSQDGPSETDGPVPGSEVPPGP